MNCLLGFFESFVADYFCRICRASKIECFWQVEENKSLLRNIENFSEDVQNCSFGVKENCVFNAIPYYHWSKNITCDELHDIMLGIGRYDMAKIINKFIQKNYFTLEHLNNRLKYFNNSEFDHGKKVSSISERHVQNGMLIMTAAEMSFFITYFSIIVGDLVPPDDLAWDLYLHLYEIVDIVRNSTISMSGMNCFNSTI